MPPDLLNKSYCFSYYRTWMKNRPKYKPCNSQKHTHTPQHVLSTHAVCAQVLVEEKVSYCKENYVWGKATHKGQNCRNMLGNWTQKWSQHCGCHNLRLKHLCASSPFPPPSPPALKFFSSSRKQTFRVALDHPGIMAAQLRAPQCTSLKLCFQALLKEIKAS